MKQMEMNPFSGFERQRDYLVCIDSDGCAMDTMDIKHHRCFGPCMVEEWGLENWRDPVLFRWNQVNLYSMTRGINRFKALALVLTEVDREYREIQGLEALNRWVEESDELSNGALEKAALREESPCLKMALHWSQAVNQEIEQLPEESKRAFPGVKEGIPLIHQYADIAVVSSANQEAVVKEWGRNGLLRDVDIVLAQNAGSKASCIRELLKYGYPADHVMMVGDAPGDRGAAEANGVWFYPILVAREYESWRELPGAVKRLAGNAFGQDYQKQLLEEFVNNLQG